jgi:hypothetical protein
VSHLLLLVVVVGLARAIDVSIFVHHHNASGIATDWRCVPYFENLTAEFGSVDPTPFGVLLTSPNNAAQNARCSGLCAPADADRLWWPVASEALCNASSALPPVCYCALDKNGACANALTVASFSHEVTSCGIAIVNDRLGAPRFKLSLALKDGAQEFQTYLHRGYTPGYECAAVATDNCTMVQSCGAWHTVHNVHDVTGQGNSPCDTACNAKPGLCESTVCWKSGASCLAGERLLSTMAQATSCQLSKPATLSCAAERPAPIDPFVRAPSNKVTVAATNICCSGLTQPPSTAADPATTAATSAATNAVSSGAVVATSTSSASHTAVALASLVLSVAALSA